MGAVTADVSRSDPEAGRVVMRRLMWHLNDESGGIGWGAPEAMGDIMARHRGLAGAYASILICYIDPRGNYLDHPGLQAGVLWAVGRLARAWPDLVQSAADLIRPFLNDPAVKVRGMAVWAALPLNDTHLTACMRALRNDPAEFELYEDHHLVHRRISELVQGLFSSVLIR
ncbi:MAG: HEAT repeat domain-containing protein, partial [Desulfatitalea sp.]|nr:HEAT repeat domain-containing protein [Desulfatitalea sp.]NNJ98965.1 HEAT repeat domain-containing protein [Desulfatitalea sp.]